MEVLTSPFLLGENMGKARTGLTEVVPNTLEGGHPFSNLKREHVGHGGEPKAPSPGSRVETTISGRRVFKPIRIRK